MTRSGIEPRSPGPLANTLTARPIKSLFSGIFIIQSKWILFGIIYYIFSNGI